MAGLFLILVIADVWVLIYALGQVSRGDASPSPARYGGHEYDHGDHEENDEKVDRHPAPPVASPSSAHAL